jgi:hypothetical protein
MSNEMNAVEVVALAKAVKKGSLDKAREQVKAGTHAVNCLVRLSGSINVGEDHSQNKTAAMPQMKMLLAALMLNGVSVEAFIRRYLDGEFEVSKDQEKEMKEIWEKLADSFNATFKGKVTTPNLSFEVVEDANA